MVNEKTVRILIYIGVGAAIVAFLMTVALVALSINPISPIKNWTARTDKTTYIEGDNAHITSNYDKNIAMDGESVRSLVCIIGQRTQEYSPVTQDTSKKTGKNLTAESDAIVPADVIDSLPKECYYKYDIDYNVFGFKSSGRTNTFTIQPKE